MLNIFKKVEGIFLKNGGNKMLKYELVTQNTVSIHKVHFQSHMHTDHKQTTNIQNKHKTYKTNTKHNVKRTRKFKLLAK